MLRLKSVTIRHWQRVRQATVQFPESGFVLVRGRNLTNVGKFESIGAGKTSLGEALARSLFGIDGKYTNLGWYSTDEEGDTYVRVEASLRGRELVVEQGWKCAELSPTGEGLRFHFDGATTERPRLEETRAELDALTGVSAELASWSVFLDGERLKFNKLSQAQSVELLMQALAQPNWDACRARADQEAKRLKEVAARAREMLAVAREECAHADALIEAAKENLAEAEATDASAAKRRAERLAAIEQAHAAATRKSEAAAGEMRKLRKQIDLAVAQADVAYREAEHLVSQTLSQLTTARTYRDGWQEEVSRLDPLSRDAQQQLKDIESEYNGVCPKCGQPLPNRPKLAEVSRAKADAAKLHADLAAARGQLDTARADVRKLEQAQDEARQKARRNGASDTGHLSRQYEALEREHDDLEAVAAEARRDLDRALAEPEEKRAPAARAVLQERGQAKARAHESAEARARDATAADLEAAHVGYWAKAFSPTGIPNMVLRQAIRPLNEAAKLTSLTMTGGALDVQFSATTELASGVEKPQLVTRVENRFGASRFQGNSKGESGLANLILAETQTTVGRLSRRVAWRWFDEVINTQDPQVRRNVYQYLRAQAETEGLLTFVVDHHPEAANYAHHVLVAEKSAAGDTSYHWD